jgi:hypothetical protein
MAFSRLGRKDLAYQGFLGVTLTTFGALSGSGEDVEGPPTADRSKLSLTGMVNSLITLQMLGLESCSIATRK